MVTDWKQWAINRPAWIKEEAKVVFGKFVEHNWKDELNMAVAEPAKWGTSATEA